MDDDEESEEESEEALVARAMARIREAKSQGRGDVDLTQAELAAINRMQERKKKEAERRRLEEKRVSIPLASLLGDDDELPEHPPPGALEGRAGQAHPPVGYFPPPSAVQPQSRKHSANSSTSRVPRGRDRNDDHSGRSSRGSRPPAQDDEMYMLPAASAPALNPEQYMTSPGPRAPPGAVAASRRNFSGPQPTVGRSQRASSDGTSDESGDDTASDEYARAQYQGRREAVMAETAPELRRSSRRHASKSPSKRKPVTEKEKSSGTSSKSRKKR